MTMMHPSEILPPANDPRDSRKPAHIARMAAHLKAGGVLPPINVFKRPDGKYEVLTGETRRQAHIEAGLAEIEVIVRDAPLSEAELLLERYRENAWHEDFNPIERATIYVGLMKLNGWSQSELAEAVGESPSKVAKSLRVSKRLVSELQEKVISGELCASMAYLISCLPAEQQLPLGERAIAGNWKRDRVDKEVRKLSGKRTKKARPEKRTLPNGLVVLIPGDCDHDAVEEDLKYLLGINRKGRKISEGEEAPLLLPIS